MKLWVTTLSLAVLVKLIQGQAGPFALPTAPQEPAKPTVPKGLESYFRLNNPSAGWVKALGLSGFIPERNFQFQDARQTNQQPNDLLSLLGGGLAPSLPGGVQLPPGLSNLPGLEGLVITGEDGKSGSGSSSPSVNNQNNAKSGSDGGSSGSVPSPLPATSNKASNIRKAQTSNSRSSISGIPNIFPTLPKAPLPQPHVAAALPKIPSIPTAPQVPNGGFGPVSRKLPLSGLPPELLSQVQPGAGTGILPSSRTSAALTAPSSSFGGGRLPSPQAPALPQSPTALANLLPKTVPAQTAANDNIFGHLANLLGIGSFNGGGTPGAGGLDLSALNSLLGLGPKNRGILSSVLYNALTDNAIQQQQKENDTSVSGLGNLANAANLRSNVALLQQLLTQPSSPLCNPKPIPVSTFDIDAFMGTWYQVLYSPPLSEGPCSMVSYKKLADVAQGGPGTVFDTFEYTTKETPFGGPKISSGYAIVRGPGQLIYRTTNSPTDVDVYILKTGPLNEKAQYDYVVLAVNCNYPLHVFARNPLQYKQNYEAEVNSFLEKRGITNGFSRLLNIIAPVDSSLCVFPPSLFNNQG